MRERPVQVYVWMRGVSDGFCYFFLAKWGVVGLLERDGLKVRVFFLFSPKYAKLPPLFV